jgi:restriction system protein
VRGVLYAGGVTEVNAAVQAKRWKYNVQAPVVQALRGSLVVHEQGMIITTSAFSPGAEKEARAPGKVRISLVDGEKLLDLLIKHGIGVIAEQHTVYSLDEDWWGDAAQAIGAGGASSATQVAKAAVTVAYPVPIRATAHDAVFEAKLLDAHGQVEFDGTVYRSPSGAGQKASGWKSCNGWTLWQYQNVETGAWHPIEELRAKQK